MMGFGAAGEMLGPSSQSSAQTGDIPLQSIVEAVRVILEPTSNATLRGQAHALCEAVKAHPQAPQYGFQLATLEMPLSARLFGLNVLEEYVKARLELKEASGLRDGIWGLLALVVAVPASERRLMQDKTAGLVAHLALRIWPQYWPDFFPRLLELVTESGETLERDASAMIRTEMGLLMARMVVDEIHPREGAGEKRLIWDDARRPELQQALALVLPEMIARLYRLLPYCANWSSQELRAIRPLMEAMMEAFGSMALWVQLEKSLVIPCFVGLLKIARTSSELAGVALEVLATLCARLPRPQEQQELIPELFDAIVDPVGELLGVYASGGLDSYDQFKRLADAFVTLCATNIGNRKVPCIPKRLDAVLDILVQLSNFPSLLVVSNVAGSFWTPASRCEKLMRHPAVAARLPSIFLYTLVTMAQTKSVERTKAPFNVEDFDEGDVEADGDFDTLFATQQNRALDLLRQVSVFYPEVFAGYCGNALGTFFAERGGQTNMANELGTQGLAQWTALVHATDAVLRACHARLMEPADALPSANLDSIKSQIHALGQVICAFSNPSTQLHTDTLYVWLTVARSLLSCLGAMNSPHFSALIQQIFSLFLSYDIPTTMRLPSDRICNMRTAVRARAGTTILRVCAANPSLFVPALDYIINLYRQSSQQPCEGKERAVFIEMLLAIAGCLEDAAQRGELVRLVLTPVAESLDQLAAIAGDWKTLLQRCGLVELLEGAPAAAAAVSSNTDAANASNLRRTISHTNATLYSTLTQLKKLVIAPEVKSLVAQLGPTVLNALSRMILCVNAIFDGRNFAHPPSVQARWQLLCGEVGGEMNASTSLVDMPPTEKLLDTHLLADNMETLPGKSLKGWLQMLRIGCFMCYGQLYSLVPGFMCSESCLAGTLALFKDVDQLSLSHWMLVTKHLFTPLLLNVPEASVALTHDIVRLIVHRFGCVRLEASWQSFLAASSITATSATTGATTAANQSGLQAESEQERLLTTATVSLLLMLFDVFVPVGERDKKTDPAFDLAALKDPLRLLVPEGAHSPLARSIMHDRSLAAQTLALLAAILRWRPTLSGKVLSIVARWLPVLMQYQELHATLFGPIATAIFSAVLSPSLSELHAQCIALLTELYKWQMFYGYDALDRQVYAILSPACKAPQELRAFFTTHATASVKTQRSTLRSLLVRPLQQHGLTATGVISTVPKLPDRLVVLRKLKKVEQDVSLDLAAFFDQ